MDKMLVIIFEKESQAFEGSRALMELQLEGSLHLYAQAIIARDTGGKVKVKLPSDSGPIGAAVSVFTQSLVGRFGEPVGPAVEPGTYGRVLFDLARLEAGEEFLAEVEHSFEPGKSALIAEVWEAGTLAVDKRMKALNGAIYRSTSSEAWDSLIQKNAAALKADLDELKAERDRASGATKTKLQKQVETTETRLQAVLGRISSRMEANNLETEAKIKSLQMRAAGESSKRKARLESQIGELQVDHKHRSDLLKKARDLIIEALSI